MAYASARIIKKYGNRRLYDTEDSHYLTQEQLGETIRAGVNVRVVDAKSGADLTQATLSQIVFEGMGAYKVLPVSLLTRLIRLDEARLAEFLGRHVESALDAYQAESFPPARQQERAPLPSQVSAPVDPSSAWARMFNHAPERSQLEAEVYDERPAEILGYERGVRAVPDPQTQSELASLRQELQELKTVIREVVSEVRKSHSAPPARRKKKAAAGKR